MVVKTPSFSKGYRKFEQFYKLLGFFKVGLVLTIQDIQAKIEN
jgi:hypothetical protein